MEDALYLTNFASKVTILVRRDVLRCSKLIHERVLQEPKIEIMYHTEAKKVL
jgi:thioredoxin reductase (NADPH)